MTVSFGETSEDGQIIACRASEAAPAGQQRNRP